MHIQREEMLAPRFYRKGRPRLSEGPSVILVDGLATGATFLASVEAIRQQAPMSLAAAIPVALGDDQKSGSRRRRTWSYSTAPILLVVGHHYAEFSKSPMRKWSRI